MSSEQRPRRLGYAISAALIAIGTVVAVILFAVFLSRVAGKTPTADHTFGNNQSTTVHLDAGGSKSIYVTNTNAGKIKCTATGTGGQHGYMHDQDFGFILTSQWRALSYFTVRSGNDYTISCSGPSDVRYGVGEYIGPEQFTNLFWGIGAGVVLVIAGIGTLIATGVRRAVAAPPPSPMQYPQQ